MDKIVLVTGANRGLGFEFVKQLLHKNYRVLATARSAQDSHELLELVKKNPNLCEFHELDVTKKETVQRLESLVAKLPHLDWLINNAGTMGPQGPSLEAPADAYEEVFRVNVLGPQEIFRSCLSKLAQSKFPIVASVSSLMGSIGDNSSGGYGPYRVSKAALNMLNKNWSREHKNITCLVLHPGWVQTRMGGTAAPLKPHDSIEGMIKVLENVTLADSGKFFEYSGRNLPW